MYQQQFGDVQPGVGQRMGAALGRFGGWAREKAGQAKNVMGDVAAGAKQVGRGLAAGGAEAFRQAGDLGDRAVSSIGGGLTGVRDAATSTLAAAGKGFSDNARVQGGYATPENIREEDAQAETADIDEQIRALGGRPQTSAQRLAEEPQDPLAVMQEAQTGQIVPPPGAEQQPPDAAPITESTLPNRGGTSSSSRAILTTPRPATTTEPQIVPPAVSPHETALNAAGMASMPTGSRNKLEGSVDDLSGLEDQSQITDDQWAQIQQQHGTVNDMLAGEEYDKSKHNAPGFAGGSYERGRQPSPFDHNQGTPPAPTGQIVPPDDDGSWDNQGPDHGSLMDNRRKIVPPKEYAHGEDPELDLFNLSQPFDLAWRMLQR